MEENANPEVWNWFYCKIINGVVMLLVLVKVLNTNLHAKM